MARRASSTVAGRNTAVAGQAVARLKYGFTCVSGSRQSAGQFSGVSPARRLQVPFSQVRASRLKLGQGGSWAAVEAAADSSASSGRTAFFRAGSPGRFSIRAHL
jgi:hypothetical protein